MEKFDKENPYDPTQKKQKPISVSNPKNAKLSNGFSKKTLLFVGLFTLLFFIILISFAGEPKYEILREEHLETSNKAQLIEYAIYKDTIYNEETLKSVVLKIYDEHKNKDLFENFDAPTVVSVYLYTSKESANDKSAWICMLLKSPTSEEPNISYNNLKMNSFEGLNDNKKDESEVANEKLQLYLKERNLELCSFYKQLGDLELESIKKADIKYPEFGLKHREYVESIRVEERMKLIQKYNLTDSIFGQVSTFGMAYCK
ncbi:hypothetical protein SL057_001385 [Flavobacterium psychrophilum]|nr:hypothetical protein [Flavobacterium psychrophilum]